MTIFYPPEVIDSLRLRAEAEPCTCRYVNTGPDDRGDLVICLACLLVGLRPTVTAHEPVF